MISYMIYCMISELWSIFWNDLSNYDIIYSVYDIIWSWYHLWCYDIMHWHYDILCYIIACISILPEIWSCWVLAARQGVCPVAFPVLSAIKRCPVWSAAFSYSVPIVDSCPPARLCWWAPANAKSGQNTFITLMETRKSSCSHHPLLVHRLQSAPTWPNRRHPSGRVPRVPFRVWSRPVPFPKLAPQELEGHVIRFLDRVESLERDALVAGGERRVGPRTIFGDVPLAHCLVLSDYCVLVLVQLEAAGTCKRRKLASWNNLRLKTRNSLGLTGKLGGEQRRPQAGHYRWLHPWVPGALWMISSMDATEEGEQNNLKQNKSMNHQMGLTLTLAVSNAGSSSMPAWSWVSTGNKFKVGDQKTECLEHTTNYENRNRFSTFISRFGTPKYVEVSRGQILDIAFELVALRWNFGGTSAQPPKKWAA